MIGTGMLHIVNGDSVAEKLNQGVVHGDVLVWRELYPAGPIFADMADDAHRAVRADYLNRTMGIPRTEYVRICSEQEKALAEFGKYDEIVLWFEHDLFDQTMLCIPGTGSAFCRTNGYVSGYMADHRTTGDAIGQHGLGSVCFA